MKQTNFDEVTDRTGTYCTQWDYIEDRFGEKNLLPFSVSDTDFKVPTTIIDTLKKRMDHEIFGYTRWNHHSFKGAIQQWYQNRFQSTIETDWVLYSPSVIYSVAKLIELKSERGDYIVMQTPAYDAFFKTITDNQRIIHENPLLFNDGHYTIDFIDLEKRLSHPKAKIFLLCSPHNPTGRVWTKVELLKIIALCQKYDVFMISDDIHMDIVRADFTYLPLTSCTTDLKNIAICSSASKTFNTPGLICSYLLIPDDKLREEFLVTLKNRDGLSSTSIFGMLSTISAYHECAPWVDELNLYVTNNLVLLQEFLTTELPEIQLVKPEATYLAWLDVSRLPYTSKQLQEALIHYGKVAIMPGNTYGTAGENFIRMNVGCPREKLIDGLQRLKLAVNQLKSQEEFTC